jgi:hypothetical protein
MCVTEPRQLEARPKIDETVPWVSVCSSRAYHTDAVGRCPVAARLPKKEPAIISTLLSQAQQASDRLTAVARTRKD